MKTIVVVTALFIVYFGNAQNSESSNPRLAIETYFDGYQKGDTTILKEVFHPSFHLSWINPWAQGDQTFMQVDREGMFEFFGPNWKNLKIKSSITEIKEHSSMAWAEARVELEGVVVWTDFINLLKIGDRWWIVSKVSVGELEADNHD